jgi:hypothetical protein
VDTNTQIILAVLAAGPLWATATKLLDVWLGRYKIETDSEAQLRKEMVERLARQDARIDALSAQLDAERTRSQNEHAERIEAERLAGDLAEKNDQLSNECAQMKRRIATLEREVADLRGAAQKRMDDPLQR